MLKFFRIIRQTLLSEGKISKYLIYALGEIVLVVIGILIALSINNMNEQNKLRKEYISDLKIIRENLAKDRINITANINNGSRYAQELKQQLASKNYFTADQNIIMQIGQPGLYFDNSGYNNAKSKNTLNLIQTDSLNNLFHEYYVREIEISQKSAIRLENYSNTLKNHYLEFGLQEKSNSKSEIMNEIMKKGPFMEYLNFYINERDEVIKELQYLRDLNTLLSKTINLELIKFE